MSRCQDVKMLEGVSGKSKIGQTSNKLSVCHSGAKQTLNKIEGE